MTSLRDSCPTPESKPKSTTRLTQMKPIRVLIRLSSLEITAIATLTRENRKTHASTTGTNIYGNGLLSGVISKNDAIIALRLVTASTVYFLINFLFIYVSILQ